MDKVNFIERLKKIKCVLFDLDGTLYLGSKVFEYALKSIEVFRKNGIKIVFLTNNSSKSQNEYIEKLKGLKLFDECDSVFTSNDATISFLKEKGLDSKVYLLATEVVKNEYLKNGIELCEKNANTAVLTFDTELTYEDIDCFNRELVLGAKYIATHPDFVCPSQETSKPDVGSFIKMFQASSGRLPEFVIGKPNCYMGEEVTKRFCVEKENVLMVGDRLYTDIAFGLNCEFLTALVFSGETNIKMYEQSQIKADGVFDSVLELSELLSNL